MTDITKDVLVHVQDPQVLASLAQAKPALAPGLFKVAPSVEVQLEWLKKSAKHVDALALISKDPGVLKLILRDARRSRTLSHLARNESLPPELVERLARKIIRYPSGSAVMDFSVNYPVQASKMAVEMVETASAPLNTDLLVLMVSDALGADPNMVSYRALLKLLRSHPLEEVHGTSYDLFVTPASKLPLAYKVAMRRFLTMSNPGHYEGDTSLAAQLLDAGANNWFDALSLADKKFARTAAAVALERRDSAALERLIAQDESLSGLLHLVHKHWPGPLDEVICSLVVEHDFTGAYWLKYKDLTPEAALAMVRFQLEDRCPKSISDIEDADPVKMTELLASYPLERLSAVRKCFEPSLLKRMLKAGAPAEIIGKVADPQPEPAENELDVLYLDAVAQHASFVFRESLPVFSAEQIMVMIGRYDRGDMSINTKSWLVLLESKYPEVRDAAFRRVDLHELIIWLLANCEMEGRFDRVTYWLPFRTLEEQAEVLLRLTPAEVHPWIESVLDVSAGLMSVLPPKLYAKVLAARFTKEFGPAARSWESALTLAPSWSGTLQELVTASRELS